MLQQSVSLLSLHSLYSYTYSYLSLTALVNSLMGLVFLSQWVFVYKILIEMINIKSKTSLLECSIISESKISIFRDRKKHLFNVLTIVDCILIKCRQWRYCFFPVNTIFHISFIMIILDIANSINAKQAFVRKQNCQCFLTLKICSYPVRRLLFSLCSSVNAGSIKCLYDRQSRLSERIR